MQENLAEKLAKSIDANLYRIIPEQPYTDADLDRMNKKSRSSVEMSDKSLERMDIKNPGRG